MFLPRQPVLFRRLRNWRGLLAVLVAVTYLFAGTAHGLCDLDVTSPAGGSEIASILDDGAAGHGDNAALAGHHCHGCFSVAVAQSAPAAASMFLVSASRPQPAPRLAGIIPDTDSPPPKHIA
ncbi:hypothetical protein [Bradyrhizobium sp. DOA1]|uniref:hypothetical protein n=1 Tax=Bradyrhizobium sp. DOA1 TaxID=1126616 RepID=UPI000A9633F4|nr:hypothetical protein [Bradyrhizobium sp. DOA1]